MREVMATAREKTMATGTAKAPAKEPEQKGEQADGVVDVAALQIELAELRGMVAGLAAGQSAAKSAGAMRSTDIEPGEDDPRRNNPIDGDEVDGKPFEPVTFRARGRSQRIVRVPQSRLTTMNGEVQAIGGIAYDFAPTGDFVAQNSNVAAFLRKRPMFNVEFWEVGNEPHAAPDPSIVLSKILQAVMELDLDALDELYQKEAASHKRKVVLDQITAAQARIKAASE